MKLKTNKSGFTLVELMVVVGLLSGLALVATSISKQMNKSSTKAQVDSDILLAHNEMIAILANPENCALTFSATYPATASSTGTYTKTIGAGTITRIVNKPGTGVAVNRFVTNVYFGTGNQKIISYALNPSANASEPDIADLTVTFEKKPILNNGVPGIFTRTIKLYTELDGSSRIKVCRSISQQNQEIWTRVVGNAQDIFYNEGKVGVGDNTPEYVLDVESGDNNILNITGTSTTYGGSLMAQIYSQRNTAGTNGLLSVGSAFSPNILYVQDSGRVGIGTSTPTARLNVAGDVRIGELNAAGAGGSQRFLYFSGSASPATWDSDNSDPLTISRFNVAGDQSQLRVSLGDNNDGTDKFVVGTTIGTYNPLFTVQSDGKVGVGISTPSHKLHVVTTTTEDGVIVDAPTFPEVRFDRSGTTKAYLGVAGAAGGYATGSLADSLILRSENAVHITNGTAIALTASGGSVGIGTTSPATDKLEVVGSVNVSGGAIKIQGQDISDAAFGVLNAVAQTEVPTKRWVQEQLARLFSRAAPEALTGLAAVVTNYAASNTMSMIKESVCANSRIRFNATGSWYGGTYSSGTCSYDVTFPNCTVSGNCTNLYATNIYGTNIEASGRICGPSGCATKFGTSKCPDGHLVAGISHGHVICRNAFNATDAHSTGTVPATYTP